MPETATLTVGDQTFEFPMIVGTEDEQAIDITQLREKTGLVTYDPSYGNTASCRSAITFIDGEKGILRYRGIPIEQFATTPDFVEAALNEQKHEGRGRGSLVNRTDKDQPRWANSDGFRAELAAICQFVDCGSEAVLPTDSIWRQTRARIR